MRIGLFGGTFDPPHIGHMISAESLAESLSLDGVIFVPSGCPPHKFERVISSAEDRCKMLELAISGNSLFTIDRFEVEKEGPCYTIDTVKYFRNRYADDELFLLIGADSLADFPNWYHFEELVELIEIVSAYRGGIERQRVLDELRAKTNEAQFEKLSRGFIRTPMIEISASEIRCRVKEGKSVRYFVMPDVEKYIIEHRLYK